jgi:hypothetical protein
LTLSHLISPSLPVFPDVKLPIKDARGAVDAGMMDSLMQKRKNRDRKVKAHVGGADGEHDDHSFNGGLANNQ